MSLSRSTVDLVPWPEIKPRPLHWECGWIPGSGRSLGEGNGNPLQFSCLGNPRDRGARWATVMESQRPRHDLGTKAPPPGWPESERVTGVVRTGEPETLMHCCWHAKWYSRFVKQSAVSLKGCTSVWPRISTLRNLLKRNENICPHTDASMNERA